MDNEPRRRGRPPTGTTPKRYIRAGKIWERGVALAEERGETMTKLVLRALEREIELIERGAA